MTGCTLWLPSGVDISDFPRMRQTMTGSNTVVRQVKRMTEFRVSIISLHMPSMSLTIQLSNRMQNPVSGQSILAAVRLRTWQTRFELGLDLKSRFRFRHYAGPDLDHSPSSQVGWTWTPGSEPGP